MCILCQQTSPKLWFGNRTMTSFYDVTNSAHQIQMTSLNETAWKVSAYATASNTFSVLTCKSRFVLSARTKQSVNCVALKTPLQIRLGICIYKTSLLHRPDEWWLYWFHTKLSPNISQQNCVHARNDQASAGPYMLKLAEVPRVSTTCKFIELCLARFGWWHNRLNEFTFKTFFARMFPQTVTKLLVLQ